MIFVKYGLNMAIALKTRVISCTKNPLKVNKKNVEIANFKIIRLVIF